MATQSKEFVGIAEKIKNREISAKRKIDELDNKSSELNTQKKTLKAQISRLKADLNSAEKKDNPDSDRISEIERKIDAAESKLSDIEHKSDKAAEELEKTKNELASILEEKAQTLFEIQEKARKTSKNISAAGGMYGAYSGVGSSLQDSMQTSLASLSRAADILDGSVDGHTGGRSASRSGSSGSSFSFGRSTSAAVQSFRSGGQTTKSQGASDYKSNQSGNAYAISSFSKNPHAAAGNSAESQYCLGVLSHKGSFPENYLQMITERYRSADPKVQRVFDRFKDKLVIQDAEVPDKETAYYLPGAYNGAGRGVYYNVEDDFDNPRTPGSTFFHEIGHMIDNAATGFNNYLSDNDAFKNALIEDGQRVLRLYNGMTAEEKSAFLWRIRADSAHAFSDLIDAITNGELCGGYGHSREYWNDSSNLPIEAFAHFFEASMGGKESFEILTHFFPTAYKEFTKMIDSLQ